MEPKGSLAGYFIFTQHSLATFASCPLKFKKRYVERLRPAGIPDRQSKIRIEAGRDFHLMAERYFLGVPPGECQAEENPELAVWMTNLMKNFPLNPDWNYLPEYRLHLGGPDYMLEATYDLIIMQGDRLEIWDWKTHPGNPGIKPGRRGTKPENSIQTMVYLTIIGELSSLLTGKPLPLDAITMKYWQPEPPGVTTEIHYGRELHEGFKAHLEKQIRLINDYDYGSFDKTLYKRHCRYCEFNRLCNGERVDFQAVSEEYGTAEEAL